MTTTHRIVKWLLLIGALACLVWVFASVPAKAEEASPSPSPTITYPTAEQVAFAKTWYRKAVRERVKLARVRACFRDRAPVRVGALPLRGASANVWTIAANRYRHLARDWRGKVRDGRKLMRCPGGTSCGTRWKPLMRFTGWPESCLDNLSYIIMRESSGRARAYNPSGAAGLCQLMPGWYRGTWGPPAGNPFDPEYNLRTALWIYRHGGWSAWAL